MRSSVGRSWFVDASQYEEPDEQWTHPPELERLLAVFNTRSYASPLLSSLFPCNVYDTDNAAKRWCPLCANYSGHRRRGARQRRWATACADGIALGEKDSEPSSKRSARCGSGRGRSETGAPSVPRVIRLHSVCVMSLCLREYCVTVLQVTALASDVSDGVLLELLWLSVALLKHGARGCRYNLLLLSIVLFVSVFIVRIPVGRRMRS